MTHPAIPAAAPVTPSILTKIVATIGPASESAETVRRLVQAGVSVFRFNFSHGTFEDHGRRLAVVRAVAAELGAAVAALGDLQGPKIRVGKIPSGMGVAAVSGAEGAGPRAGGGVVEAVAGRDVVFKQGITEAFVRGAGAGEEPVLPVTYARLVEEVGIGHRVMVNDGAVRMIAVERDLAAGELRCRVTSGGAITSGKGINLPQSDVSAPAITERDWACVRWAVEHDLDFLALSFVRRAEEVRELKAYLESVAGPGGAAGGGGVWIPVVAKIEKPQALAALGSIVEAADAVMVARGDLGVEMDIAKVPVAQKEIIEECARQGKPCIVATQMLETMIESTAPTRAEASDVANAIFDGADAVMLSAETAAGRHPALVVETMARIIACAEERVAGLRQASEPPTRFAAGHASTAALAHGAWHIARDLSAKAVACWSEHGGTARYLSQNSFAIPILAYSSSPRAARRMALLAGVTPICCAPPGTGTLSEWNEAVDEHVQRCGLAQAGDTVVLLAGRPLGRAKTTNTIAIHRVGEPAGGYRAQG